MPYFDASKERLFFFKKVLLRQEIKGVQWEGFRKNLP